MNNLTQTQQDAKAAYLNKQSEQIACSLRKGRHNRKKRDYQAN